MAATRAFAVLAAALCALMLWIVQAGAQDRVDCGNGAWCPSGHACLLGGQCGREIDAPPGSVRTTNGWCDPGYRESRLVPDKCVPPNYVECNTGLFCPPGATCVEGGGCRGGPPVTGPMCGNVRCSEGRICSSAGSCMNTALSHDCGNGSICSHASACQQPKGCVYVGPERVPQNR